VAENGRDLILDEPTIQAFAWGGGIYLLYLRVYSINYTATGFESR
jgi:hypothetical protein